MKKSNEAKILATVGAGLAALALNTAQANPFAVTELSQGYMVAEAPAVPADAKAQDAKCGAKAKDAKCGEAKKAAAKAKADADMKAKDGKCGEGKCGNAK